MSSAGRIYPQSSLQAVMGHGGKGILPARARARAKCASQRRWATGLIPMSSARRSSHPGKRAVNWSRVSSRRKLTMMQRRARSKRRWKPTCRIYATRARLSLRSYWRSARRGNVFYGWRAGTGGAMASGWSRWQAAAWRHARRAICLPSGAKLRLILHFRMRRGRRRRRCGLNGRCFPVSGQSSGISTRLSIWRRSAGAPRSSRFGVIVATGFPGRAPMSRKLRGQSFRWRAHRWKSSAPACKPGRKIGKVGSLTLARTIKRKIGCNGARF